MTRSARRAAPPLVLGLAVIALGVLFTLDNLGLVEVDAALRYWPIVLIVVGLLHLLNGRIIGGVGWTVAGVLLLLANLAVIDIDIFDLWPLLLILLGLHIVRRGLGGPRPATTAASTEVHSLAFLSGHSQKCTCPDFDSGEVTAILGGSEIDLTRAEMTDGERVVDVFALWGGVEIKVPRDWTVVGRVNTFLGAYEDRTERSQSDPDKRLVVQGIAVMGGVEVSN
jgi:predicted membrane protein